MSDTSSPPSTTLAAIHANRAGLYKVKGDLTSALDDIKKAIAMDPINMKYRETISLLHRVCYQTNGGVLYAEVG